MKYLQHHSRVCPLYWLSDCAEETSIRLPCLLRKCKWKSINKVRRKCAFSVTGLLFLHNYEGGMEWETTKVSTMGFKWHHRRGLLISLGQLSIEFLKSTEGKNSIPGKASLWESGMGRRKHSRYTNSTRLHIPSISLPAVRLDARHSLPSIKNYPPRGSFHQEKVRLLGSSVFIVHEHWAKSEAFARVQFR